MPTGFDVESGANLSNKLLAIVDRMGAWLQRKRNEGESTPDKPTPAAAIISYCRDYLHAELESPDVRAMVNYLRRNKKPIGSSAGGYFWAVNHNELRPTLEHMYQRINAMAQAADGLKYADFGEEKLL